MLANAQVSAKKYDDAITSCDKALSIDQANAQAWGYRAKALYELRRYDEALIAFDKGLAIQPNNPALWYSKGLTLEDHEAQRRS